MDPKDRLVEILKPPVAEVITEEELRVLLESRSHIVAYNGFEPSGLLHIATGLLPVLKIKDLVGVGVKFIIFLADWHAWLNERFDRDLRMIYKAGEYMLHGWRSLGLDIDKLEREGLLEVRWASETYDREYWRKVLEVGRMLTIARARRALTIAGRQETEMENRISQLLYAPMQIADVFHLGIDICVMGMDQRRANVLAREIGDKLGKWKPIAIHYPVISDLKGRGRMSVSSASREGTLYIHDEPALIEEKIKRAYCPEKSVSDNPVAQIMAHIVIPDYMRRKKEPIPSIKLKNGDVVEPHDPGEFISLYSRGKIHPLDLKRSVIEYLSIRLEPCRKYFETNEKAMELYNHLLSYQVKGS